MKIPKTSQAVSNESRMLVASADVGVEYEYRSRASGRLDVCRLLFPKNGSFPLDSILGLQLGFGNATNHWPPTYFVHE